MENVLKTHSSIYVNEIKIPIRRLINSSKRIILSNVCPTIPNQLIIEAFNSLGIKTISPITHMKASFSTEQFSHILSFRRQVYINQDSIPKIPSSITVTVEDATFRIFITDDTVTCFQCHQTGHFSNQCKNIPDPINVNNETDNGMDTLDLSLTLNLNKNVPPSSPILNTHDSNITHEIDNMVINHTNKNNVQTSNDSDKSSLLNKLKFSANKNNKEILQKQTKRSAPSSSCQSLSPKSLQLLSSSSTLTY